MVGRSLTLLFSFLMIFSPLARAQTRLGLSDEELLETIEKQSFNYFLNERNPKTGLVRDRANNFQSGATAAKASIAATGFGLTAYGVGVKRNWTDYASAREITFRTLQFFLQSAAQEHGFFYHYLDFDTGERAGRSEVSPIDTALFLAGALFAAEFYEDSAIRDLAMKIYERVDWPWLLHGGDTFVLSWSPEDGFNRRRWDHYDESMILYVLAIGSLTHPIPAKSWHAIARPAGSYKNYRLIQMPPLFTHQYAHIWLDLRNKNDGHADYFQNSVNATLANRAFAMDQASKFSSYGANSWGITASDGPFGYRAYGAPPGWAEHDGTVAPTACGSSIVFTPKESLACLRYFYENLGEKLWGQYGFSDAFNLDKDWFSKNAIGIDQGALLLMIENYRSGFIWEMMDRNSQIQQAMKDIGFKTGTMELPWPDPPVYEAPYAFGGLQVDGYLKDWPAGTAMILDKNFLESGNADDDKDLKGEIRFAWDEDWLYFYAKVADQDLHLSRTGKNLWQDDAVELFIDAEDNGLDWYSPRDFQIGFRAHQEDEGAETWSWFQGGEDPAEHDKVRARGFAYEKGYQLEGAVRWDYLGIRPAAGATIRISPAVHDVDKDHSGGKLQWFFRNEEAFKRFALGKVILKSKPQVGEPR